MAYVGYRRNDCNRGRTIGKELLNIFCTRLRTYRFHHLDRTGKSRIALTFDENTFIHQNAEEKLWSPY
jgi:hypothetical protein